MNLNGVNSSIEKYVLVVDDEPMVRDFVAKVLTRNGFSCRTATDAGEAVVTALVQPPSLVVTDIRMPGKDGVWLLSELRKHWPLVPVIVLTAVSEAKEAVECLKAGAQDYLLKPVDIDELLSSVRRGVEGARNVAKGADRSSRLQEALSTIQAALQESTNPGSEVAPAEGGGRRSRAAEELDIFHKLASATRYSLDLQHVAAFLMKSLHRIVDYDAAALLLLEDEPSLTIQSRSPRDEDFNHRVRAHIANTLQLTCGLTLPPAIEVRSIEAPELVHREAPTKLRSFVNVPLSVRGSVVGLIHVSCGRDRAFGDEEILFVHRAADFLSSSVQGVRELLAAVKGRIEQMVDHMTDGVLMLDAKGRVAAMNGAARVLLGCEETETPAPETLSELLEGDLIGRIGSEKRSFKKLVCLRGVAYQMQISPVESETGELAGIVLAFRDFEEEKKAGDMKTEVVNVVSHELRTPLTAIRNALALLEGTKLGSLSAGQHRFVDLAKRNVDQLIGTINDLLDLSKIEAGKMHLALAPICLNHEIEDAVASLQPQAEAKAITLQSGIAADLPPVFGDAASIQRVMINLVGNAIKFTDRGGTVTVESKRADDDETAGEAGAIRVIVQDSGIGIPQNELASIFEKFHRLESGQAVMAPGTGLGLSISRELVKAHHGRIWAESETSRGSRFSFVIPILSQRELLVRTLSSEVARASELESSLTLVVGRLHGAYAVRARSEEEYQRAMDAVLAMARKLVRRSSDLVLLRKDTAEVAVILPRTPREGGVAFANRFAEEMARTVSPDSKLLLNVVAAQYPEEGRSPEDLYSAALEKIGEIVAA